MNYIYMNILKVNRFLDLVRNELHFVSFMGSDIREYKSCDAVNQFFRQYHHLLLFKRKV